MQLSASIGSNLRYYGELNRLVSVGHQAGGGFSAQLGRRTSVSVNETVSYAPLYSRFSGLQSIATAGAVTDSTALPAADSASTVSSGTDRAVASGRSYTSSTTLGISQAVSRRGSLTFNAGLQNTTYGGAPGFSDLRAYDVGGQFSYGVSRNGALRLGYTYRQAAYTSTYRPVTHDIDAGLDYQIPLTRSRRTTAAFSIGSTIVSNPVLNAQTGVTSNQSQYRAIGNASLTHQMGRTWRVQGLYDRGVGFIPGLTGPVSTGVFTVSTDGSLNRRTTVLVSAGYSTGDSSLSSRSTDFKTYTGDARVQFALTSRWAAYVEYLYYLYDFNSGAELPPGVSPRLQRNSARVGLSLTVPLRRS